MDEIIRKLYYGKVYPSESVHPDSEQYRDMVAQRSKLLVKFRVGLNEEQAVLFGQIADQSADINDEACLCMFHEGVRFGVAIMEACREPPK